MGRLIYLELKRVVSGRSTWILMLAVVLLSAVMAYFPISFVNAYQADDQGNVHELKGKEAIEYQKEAAKEVNGEITEEKIRQAILVFQECYRQYGGIFPPEVPTEVYARKVAPVYPVLKMVSMVLTQDDVYLETMTDADIDPKDASRFYEEYREGMAQKGRGETEQEKIRKLNEDVEVPFTYVSGFSSASFDYLALYILLLLLALVIIISPIFSAEYQTGADHILRCTKFGRGRLAAAKIVTAVLIFAVTFAAGTGTFLLITNLVFGTDGLKTSVQMLNAVFVIPALTVGQTQGVMEAGGFLSVLAMVSCTLYLSARCRNVQDTLKIALLLSLLPTIIYTISSANLANIIRCLLPSGGIGLMNTFVYEVLGNNFAHIGQAAVWTPYLIIGAAAVEIPLFLILTVSVYCRRESV